MNDMFNIFSIVGVIVPILVIGVFIFVFTMMFSPKLRGKMMSKQIESLKQKKNHFQKTLNRPLKSKKMNRKLLILTNNF